MKNTIALLAVSLVVLPLLFAQSDLPSPDMSGVGYLGMVVSIEGDQLTVTDATHKTNGNYLVIEDAAGQKIERSRLALPCEAMAEFKFLPQGKKLITRLIVLQYYEVVGGRLVKRESF